MKKIPGGLSTGLILVLLCGSFAGAIGLAPGAIGWSSPMPISNTAGSSYYPRLGHDGADTLHLVWQDWVDLGTHWPYILYAQKSSDGSWSAYTYLPGNAQGVEPALGVGADGVVHVVFMRPDNSIAYVQRTADGVWSAVETVSATSDYSSGIDVAVAPDGTVHVAWRYCAGTGQDGLIYHRARSSTGSWGNTTLVSTSGGDASLPLITTDTNSTVHVLWNRSASGEYGIDYAAKPTGGSWSAPQELANSATLSSVEQLAHDTAGALHLVWSVRDGVPNPAIYHVQKPLGQPWAAAEHVHSGYVDQIAVTTAENGLAHIAWSYNGWLWHTFQNPRGGWFAPTRADMRSGLLDLRGALTLAVDAGGAPHAAWDSGPVFDPPDGTQRGEVWYTAWSGPLATSTVITDGGGNAASASGLTVVAFPPGAVLTDTLITHTPVTLPPSAMAVVDAFDLSATQISDGVSVTSFLKPFTLTVGYTDAGKGAAIEATLGLYWRDGDNWTAIPSAELDSAANVISTTLDHLTVFAVMGETHHVYLPLVLR